MVFPLPAVVLTALTLGTVVGVVDPGVVGVRAPFATPLVQAQESTMESPIALGSTTWYISSWSEDFPLGPADIQVAFQDGRIRGMAGCNSFFGTYSDNGDRLTVAQMLGTTRKACAEEIMARENLFLQLLPQVTSYRINDQGELELTYAQGEQEGILAFIPASKFNPLHNTQWQLLSLGGLDPVDDARLPILEISGDRLSGSGGCNRLMGRFTIKGNNISIDERMASTMMACSEPLMDQEQAFIRALIAAQTYEINGDRLTINYVEDGTEKQLEFALIPEKPAPEADN